MSKEKQFWKNSRNSYKRSFGTKGLPKQRFLIICEGEKTEPNYFKAFRVSSADIKIIGLGTNTIDLVQRTKEIYTQDKKSGNIYDQVWCVFDRDSFPNYNFDNAIKKAESLGFHVAYSNEAFELWYLLHYHYYDSAISRGDYIIKLTRLIGKEYKKNDVNIYQELLHLQDNAISNSKRLFLFQDGKTPSSANPSTRVNDLVCELNKYK